MVEQGFPIPLLWGRYIHDDIAVEVFLDVVIIPECGYKEDRGGKWSVSLSANLTEIMQIWSVKYDLNVREMLA